MFRFGLLLALILCLSVDAGRFADLTKRFENTPDQAKVLAHGYLGGAGTEWLSSGGFQSDGTIVLVGTSLGPKLSFAVPETVIGSDTKAPPAPEPKVRMNKGKPVTDKAGKPQLDPFTWSESAATAFVVRMSSDAKTILSVTRFPWQAGGATSAVVDDKDNIYLTGAAGPFIASLGRAEALKPAETAMKSGACSQIYVAKLTPNADRVRWLKTLAGSSDAPSLTLTKSNKLQLQSADIRVLSLEGVQDSLTVIPGGITTKQGSTNVRTTAVNPRDGTYVRAGERHWPTGREPYRDPILNIHKADGKLLYELYHWDGPLVGLDNLRLVSDSAVRRVRFDDDGNLVIYAWSDGGNSVMLREPNDLRRESKMMKGLGMSAWGANVLSCAYIIKIEPKNYKVVGGTLWLAYRNDQDKPNTVWIDALGFALDGSVCFAGRAASNLIQTGNKLSKDETSGSYITVLNKDCSSLRFSSIVANTGKVDVRDGETWGIVSGKVKGKDVTLFVGSATEGAPGASKFAGGHSDGYFVLLDLSAGK